MKRRNRSNESTFPFALYNALQAAHEKGIADKTISWLPDGSGFKVLNRVGFMTLIKVTNEDGVWL